MSRVLTRDRLGPPLGSRRRDERGTVAVVVAMFSLTLFGFAAMVVDLGQVRDARVQAQTAADAAALAAINTAYASGTPVADVTAAVAAAKSYAADNAGITTADWTGCTDPGRPAGFVASSTPCISFSPNTTRPATVRVNLPLKATPTGFSAVLGKTPPATGATSEATVRIDGVMPCALCIMGTGAHSLQQGDLNVNGGDIYVNGSLSIGSNGVSDTTGDIFVQGAVTGSNYSPTPKPGPVLVDPLAKYTLPAPPAYGLASTAPKTDPCTQGPGIYGTWSLPSNASCVLAPGLYVIAGTSGSGNSSTWNLSGNSGASVTGTGVTLYFTCGTPALPRACNAGESGANLDLSGQASVKLAGPTSGPLWGMTLVYDRNNTGTFRMAGNAQSSITGSVYMPSGTAIMNGNGCLAAYATAVVVGDIQPNGNSSCLTLTYDSSKAAQSPADNLRLTR